MNEAQTVTISILDKEYQVSCRPDEVGDLKLSASYLDEKMREVKSGSNVFGLERIAVMAALNIAHDLLTQSRRNDEVISAQASEIGTLTTKLDQAIERFRSGAQ